MSIIRGSKSTLTRGFLVCGLLVLLCLPQAAFAAPHSYADTVDKVLRSVVSINASSTRGRGGGRSTGSGVIVRRNGLILTNNHVVKNASQVKVILHDGLSLDAEIVGTDEKSDLALLRVKAKRLPAIRVGDSSKLRVGDVVLAIGNPFGVGQTVTAGIVSALSRTNVDITDYEDFIQTDAAINPGNSGGALVTAEGELVGINTAIYSRTGGSHGIGFAIPVQMALPIMESLLLHGRVVRGWLGVSIQDIDPEIKEALDLHVDRGALISQVDPDGPAHRAKLRRGDVIVAVNGSSIRDVQDLRNRISIITPGKTAQLRYARGRRQKTVPVAIGSLDTRTSVAPGSVSESRGILKGVRVANLTPRDLRQLSLSSNNTGVIVRGVDRRSVAGTNGLRVGDAILEVNRRGIRSTQEFWKIVGQNDSKTLLLIIREGHSFYMLIRANP
jgi:serine protease Do